MRPETRRPIRFVGAELSANRKLNLMSKAVYQGGVSPAEIRTPRAVTKSAQQKFDALAEAIRVLAQGDECPDPATLQPFKGGTRSGRRKLNTMVDSVIDQARDCHQAVVPPPENILPQRFCCLPDGTCRSMTETECTALAGSVVSDCSLCGGGGACCLPDGSCLGVPSEISGPDCAAAGGTFTPAVSCLEVVCDTPPPAEGACCYNDGRCSIITTSNPSFDCVNTGGIFPFGSIGNCFTHWDTVANTYSGSVPCDVPFHVRTERIDSFGPSGGCERIWRKDYLEEYLVSDSCSDYPGIWDGGYETATLSEPYSAARFLGDGTTCEQCDESPPP